MKAIQIEPMFNAFIHALDRGQKIDDIEREYIRAALIKYKGKKSDVARALGMSIRQLYVKIDVYNLNQFKGNISRRFDQLFAE